MINFAHNDVQIVRYYLIDIIILKSVSFKFEVVELNLKEFCCTIQNRSF